ncbi:alginate lyase family protein [Streptomyces sp. NPDC017991]|uniref:alginate lyase family protein n=1 Tax=Streptomyces sp. NPDC017991 TaxID=3365026 RepID=UPI0037AA3134
MSEPQSLSTSRSTSGAPSRRRFLQITAVGTTAAATSVALASRADAITSFIHPGVLHKVSDITRMKTRIAAGTEPWLSGWNAFRANTYSQSTYAMQGPFASVDRGSTEVHNWEFWNDCNAAYQNALMWNLTGTTAHATKALQIIRAWSSTLTSITGKDAQLAASIYGFKFAAAAELMRYTAPSGSWSAADITQTENMIKNVLVPLVRTFGDAGWGTNCIKAMMAFGVFCNDTSLYNAAVDAFHTHSCCRIDRVISDTGQCVDSGRDQAHTQLILASLAEACEIAWIQTEDLYSAAANRLLAGFEYTAKYNTGNDVPYTTWGSCQATFTSLSTVERGNLRPVYEMVHNHYVKRRGLAAPWTYTAIQRIRPEGAAFQCDHPGFGTLLFTL